MTKQTHDPLRARLLEITDLITDKTSQLRDYAIVPGNAWLAKSELQSIGEMLSELDGLLGEIKDDDAERGL